MPCGPPPARWPSASRPCHPRGMSEEPDLTEQLLEAVELLEAIARDRALLDGLSPAERVRFVNAAGAVFSPDIEERRQQTKARRRREKTEKRHRDESVLTETGIRQLRAKPVFTTPNVFVPDGFDQETVDDEVVARGVGEEQHCYVCKQHYRQVHHFYDQ